MEKVTGSWISYSINGFLQMSFFRLVTNAKVFLMPHLLFNKCLWLQKATFDRPSGYISVAMEIQLTGSGWEDLYQSLSHYIHKHNQKTQMNPPSVTWRSHWLQLSFSLLLSGISTCPAALVWEICGWPGQSFPYQLTNLLFTYILLFKPVDFLNRKR